ncbi:MAG: hypothetical protein H7A51_13560 [Akkermansiaceae bacterium]|nr:hypothetical protein [Akkermansiaceae bacterium]
MKTSIIDLIRERQHVSFLELTHAIPGFSGDITMVHGDDPNIILWHSLSKDAYEALTALLYAGEIFVHPTNSLLYTIDGGTIDLPVIKRPPSGGYKTPHWYPVTFCDYPFDPDKAGKSK